MCVPSSSLVNFIAPKEKSNILSTMVSQIWRQVNSSDYGRMKINIRRMMDTLALDNSVGWFSQTKQKTIGRNFCYLFEITFCLWPKIYKNKIVKLIVVLYSINVNDTTNHTFNFITKSCFTARSFRGAGTTLNQS